MEIFDKYIGRVFDRRYKIVKLIGIGGMAVVFEAIDLSTNHVVAVKMLKEEIAKDTPSVKRFINESKAVAMLSHPNIVRIYDVSVRDNLKYIVMERVEGITLKAYMNKKGALSLRETISFTEQILRALEHAHSKGIIHRDIKPQNIMLLKNGCIKVTDFGIAKLPDAETVTTSDKAIGTVYYISPEQASGHTIDPRSDIYSLGVMMYEMITGTLPFTADTPVSVALMQVNDMPEPPRRRNPAVPVGLEQIILHAMEKNPPARFQSAGQMLRALSQIKTDPNYVFKVSTPSQSAHRGGGAVSNAHTKTIPRTTQSSRKSAEPPPKRKQSRSMLPIISGVTAAFLIVIGLSAAYIMTTLFSSSSSNETYTIAIPQFVGRYYDDTLRGELEEADCYRVQVSYEYNAEYEENMVIEQNPSFDERRKVLPGVQYTNLYLTVSRGAKTVTLPDYTVKEYRAVEELLRADGLIPEVEHVYHDTMLIGYVIKTEPAAGEVVQSGARIKLYVSKGQDIKMTQVPDFVGKTEAEARKLLIEYSLGLGKVTYTESDKPKGTILFQSISAYTDVPEKSTRIDLEVSSGPAVVEPPIGDLPPDEGEHQETIEEMLERLAREALENSGGAE